jgi:hypothetical protein
LESKIATFIIRDYIFLLYDCLKDDDEEIRDLSADIVADIFRLWRPRRKSFGTATASVASIKLAKLIVKIPEISEISMNIAIQRMTGCTAEMKELSTSIGQRFQTALADNTALFAVEKQNLYVDEVYESNTWATVLKRLPYKLKYVHMLEKWTIDGLQLLINTTQDHEDGALGWTSKPEMFILAFRIINAVNVLLVWLSSQEDVQKASGLRNSLAQFIQDGEKSGLHELIMAKAKKVLEDAIILLLRHVTKSLKKTIE